MAVTLLTHAMIAREAAGRLREKAHFLMRVNRGREEEFGRAHQGYKIGDSVTIAIPPAPVVYSTNVFADGGTVATFAETSVSLTLDTRKHTGLTFTSAEKTLEMSNFKERILFPSIDALIATMEADLISRACKFTPNLVGTAGSTPTTAKTFGQARAMMGRALAPDDNRTLLMTSEANVEMVDASKALFNPAPSISKMFTEGAVLGMFQGALTFEAYNMPSFGNVADIVMTVNGATQTGSVLTVAGAPGAPFLNAGVIFTLPAVYKVHPLTGVATTELQQFTVLSSTATTITISPPITTSAPNKTVSASPTDTNALTFVGAASTNYMRSLMFHRDAYTVAVAPLAVIAGAEGYTYTQDGISVRVMTGGDFTNDAESTRIDVLYGIAAPRPLWAAQIVQ